MDRPAVLVYGRADGRAGEAARRGGKGLVDMMNRYERGGSGEAVVEYLDSNIRVVKPGTYVRCAVTGQAIPLDQLKYWSVERQEAYASPEAVLKRLGIAAQGA